MTNKQREKIYRLAAELIADETWDYCCKAIAASCGLDNYWDVKRKMFPELFMFKFRAPSIIWWDEKDRESRILALLICSEMCKDK